MPAKRKSKKSVGKANKINKPLANIKQGPKLELGWAVAALVLNIIIPGVGSIVGNRTREGIWQLVLFLCGIILSIILIGVPIVVAAWVWSLITGILILRDSM